MGIKQRRERERQELKQSILLATRDIAVREGWQSVTIRKVADWIEYSPPTIYEYFGSKEAIFLELMRQGFQLLLAELQTARLGANDSEVRLLGMATAYWEFAWKYPELYQVMHGLDGVSCCQDDKPQEAHTVFVTVLEVVQDIVQVTDADIRNLEDEVAILWATLHGLVSLTMNNRMKGGKEKSAVLVQQAVHNFLVAWGTVKGN